MKELLRRSFKRGILGLQELSGVSIISNRSRDLLLDRAPWLRTHFLLSERTAAAAGHLPDGAESHLRYDHPALLDLRRRYNGHPAAGHVQWSSKHVQQGVDIRYFRADNLYVFQSRRYPPLAFYASGAYARLTDESNLWDRLDEDDAFGPEIFDFHGKTISRDLLDSILEINYLERQCQLLSGGRAVNVLDIGAGYGRLAHRLGSVLPKESRYFCADAVAESTFIAQYYLDYRQLGDRAQVIALDELDAFRKHKLDLAINIHSFPECRLSAIAWWLEHVRDWGAECLFIVVAASLGLTSNEGAGRRRDFQPLIEQMGYRLAHRQAKFDDSDMLQGLGLYPSLYYFFRRA